MKFQQETHMRVFVVSLMIWVFVAVVLILLAEAGVTTRDRAVGFSLLAGFFMIVIGGTIVSFVIDGHDDKHPKPR